MADDQYEWDSTPPEREDYVTVQLGLLPEKSRQLYEAQWDAYVKWCQANRILRENYSTDESIFNYTSSLLEKLAPTTVRSRLAMLKATIFAHDDVKPVTIKAEKLLDLKDKKYQKKKSEVFTRDEINKFLEQAPDEEFLLAKVIASLGIFGALRKCELHDLTVADLDIKEDDGVFVYVKPHKSEKARRFYLTWNDSIALRKYLALRSTTAKPDLLLTYRGGKVINLVVGINTIGKVPEKIAKWLNLREPQSYTGHAFRRTAATLAAEGGADLLDLKRLGGWQSDTVAQDYIAESDTGARKRASLVRNENLGQSVDMPPAKKAKTGETFNNSVFTNCASLSFSNCTFNLVTPQ